MAELSTCVRARGNDTPAIRAIFEEIMRPSWKSETGTEMFERFIYSKMALDLFFACQPPGGLVLERLRPSSVLERDVEMMSIRVRRPD